MTPKEEIKTALCFKDGFMNNGRQFCFKNKVYEYTIVSSGMASHEYSVKSETSFTLDHSMSSEFFEKYFLPDWKPIKHIPLEEDLFEI